MAPTAVPPTANHKAVAVKKLDIACGQDKKKGFKGIDLSGDADITHDLNITPWPIKTNTVEEVNCVHYVEHIPHHRPEWGTKDGWFVFFDELHRILKPDGVAEFIHPYVWHARAFWDPTHVRFIHEVTWYYLSRQWREANQLDHYQADCDFEVVTIEGVGLSDESNSWNQERQQFSRNHYINLIPDLHVIIRAVK